MTVRVPCGDESRIGEVRRAADAIAASCALDDVARSTLAIVVTEAAMNLARHARDGVVLLRDLSTTGVAGVEVIAMDCGPGMNDLERFFTDGYSTGGTSGAGLGAMRRQADALEVYSRIGQGTVVLARVVAAHAGVRTPRLLDVGVVCVPLAGESVCGDGWCIRHEADRASILLVDGLGHGSSAAEAADAAMEGFLATNDRTPEETVALLHEALRRTRGAAIAIAQVTRSPEGATVTLCGVGNTVSAVVGLANPRSLPSMNGTAGLTVGGLKSFTQQLMAGETLVMHTDGISTRWRMDAYPGLAAHHPAIVAAVLQRDHSRRRDDATVLACRLRPRESI